jgi:hypothetical protein
MAGYRNGICKYGVPKCPTETTLCGDTCADTKTDPANCGACGVTVPATAGCADGAPHCAGNKVICDDTLATGISETSAIVSGTLQGDTMTAQALDETGDHASVTRTLTKDDAALTGTGRVSLDLGPCD